MDNVIQSKTLHAKRKQFASKIALKFQVALYYILLTTKLQIINLNHMLFGLTKQVINLLIYSMLLKQLTLMSLLVKLFSVLLVMDAIETGLKVDQIVVLVFHQTIKIFVSVKACAGQQKNMPIIPLFN